MMGRFKRTKTVRAFFTWRKWFTDKDICTTCYGCPPKIGVNIGRIEWALIVMNCVLDLVRVLYSTSKKAAGQSERP